MCIGSPTLKLALLRHDRALFADLGRLLFDILRRFFCQAAGRSLRCGMVCSHQTFIEFGVWHPHWHISQWMVNPRHGMGFRRASVPATLEVLKDVAIIPESGYDCRYRLFLTLNDW